MFRIKYFEITIDYFFFKHRLSPYIFINSVTLLEPPRYRDKSMLFGKQLRIICHATYECVYIYTRRYTKQMDRDSLIPFRQYFRATSTLLGRKELKSIVSLRMSRHFLSFQRSRYFRLFHIHRNVSYYSFANILKKITKTKYVQKQKSHTAK